MISLDNKDKIFTIQDDISNIISTYQGSPIVIDMGCGHGDYMLANCTNDRNVLWIGIDISLKRVKKTRDRLLRAKNENFILFASDGQDILAMIPEKIVDTIHINFPDPWLRNKQWKNRLFRPSFVTDLLRVLKKGGNLLFVTDIREYADSVAEILHIFPQWDSLFDPIVQENIFESFPTLFYRKMSSLRPISYIKFKKNN